MKKCPVCGHNSHLNSFCDNNISPSTIKCGCFKRSRHQKVRDYIQLVDNVSDQIGQLNHKVNLILQNQIFHLK
jgi:transcription elongation factor Elf1